MEELTLCMLEMHFNPRYGCNVRAFWTIPNRPPSALLQDMYALKHSFTFASRISVQKGECTFGPVENRSC